VLAWSMIIFGLVILTETVKEAGLILDNIVGTIFVSLLIITGILSSYRWLKRRYMKGKMDRFPPKDILAGYTKEMLGFTNDQRGWKRTEISKPIVLTTTRLDATLDTILFFVDLKQRSEYRVVVFKAGNHDSRKLLDHIEDSLHHENGPDYSLDGSKLQRFPTDRSVVLGYADPTIYRTHPEPHSGYGNRFMPTSTGERPFIFGPLDGLLVWTSLSGERDELIEICGHVVDNHMDWSRAVEGQETGPQSHDGRIKPNKLSWLLMDSTTRHGAFLNSKYDHRKKRGHVPAVGQKRLVEAPEFLVLRNRFEKFLAENEQIVHRIKAKNMHGDCRAANWIWHYGARRPKGTTPDRKYRVIDYANYMASSFKRGRLKQRPLNRESSLQIKGEEGPEEITWVRPFILGGGETRPHTDDILPDPLFDLAELIASLLLDLWVNPERDIEDEMKKSQDYGGQSRRELIHEVFFEEGEKSRAALKFQFAYESIIDATIPRVEEWIDSIDDSRRSRQRSGVRAKEATKEWFRWAIADRLMYRACVISTNEGYDLLIAEDDENGTPEIALKIALKVLDFDEEQHKKSPEVGYDLEKYIQYFANVLNIDASDNKGKQEFNIEQKSDIVVEDRQGSKYGIDFKMKSIPRFKTVYRDDYPLSHILHDVETGKILEKRLRSHWSPSFLQNRTADWKPDTKVWAELDDGQFKFASINQVRESSEGELEMDITTHVTGSEDTEEDRMTLPMAKVSRRIAVLKSKGVPTEILYKYHLVGAPRFEVGQTVYIEDLDRASEFDLPPIEERNPLSFGLITHFYLCPHRNPKERRIIVEVQMDHTGELRLYPYERLHRPGI